MHEGMFWLVQMPKTRGASPYHTMEDCHLSQTGGRFICPAERFLPTHFSFANRSFPVVFLVRIHLQYEFPTENEPEKLVPQMNTPDLESLLRSAPQPLPPADLAKRLIQHSRRMPIVTPLIRSVRPSEPSSWRWWSPWFLAGSLVAGATTIVWQKQELAVARNDLSSAVLTRASGSGSVPTFPVADAAGLGVVEDPRAEIERLQFELATLNKAATEADQFGVENNNLRAQSNGFSELSPEQTAAMEAALRRAEAITCVNNLKQIGLAVRIFAADSPGKFPSDLTALHDALGSPKVLNCPSDPNHQPAVDWSDYSPANLSYEYLASDGSEAEPERVLTRCRVHGIVGLCDGSVQILGTNSAARIVTQDGKLYLK